MNHSAQLVELILTVVTEVVNCDSKFMDSRRRNGKSSETSTRCDFANWCRMCNQIKFGF